WRAVRGTANSLHEQHESFPSERLVQIIWHQQRLQRDQLVTLDGQNVRVLHPGFKNHESGPDFRNAVVRVEGESARNGDVEIDPRPGGWHAQGHDRNPAFGQIILRVVWEGLKAAGEGPPTIALSQNLDTPLAELSDLLGEDSMKSLPENLQGQCRGPLRELD